MNWKSLFTAGKSITADQARQYMADKKVSAFSLLDVRQPSEYEKEHLPAALLIPLRELPARLMELDKDKPVIVYCAVGGRSKAAAQFLAGKGFVEVYNLIGGINAWHGRKATGQYEKGLELLCGGMKFADGLQLAFAMEDGLERFYRLLAEKTSGKEQEGLFQRLAGFEARHKALLASEYGTVSVSNRAIPCFSGEQAGKNLMEGGVHAFEVLAQLETKVDILELAMMFETQALDLYGRLGRKAKTEAIRNFFLGLADEELKHLSYLTDELEGAL